MRKSRTRALRRQRVDRVMGWFGLNRPAPKKPETKPKAVPKRSAPANGRQAAVASITDPRPERAASAPPRTRIALPEAPSPSLSPPVPEATPAAAADASAPAARVLDVRPLSGPKADAMLHLAEVGDELERAREREKKNSRKAALFVSLGVHVIVAIAMVAVVLPGGARRPPELVVGVPEKPEDDKTEEMQKRRQSQSAAPMPKTSVSLKQVVANVSSPVALPTVDIPLIETGAALMPGTGIGLGRGHMNFGREQFKSSTIGGLMVRANRLGVILDDSPSMTPYLPALRSEIRKKFRGSVFREVSGCYLASTTVKERTAIMTFYDPEAVMMAFVELIEEHKVDAVYWFSDLQDGETEKALDQLEELLGIKGGGRRVRFYVRSVDEKPGKRLGEIIQRSGGELEVGG